MLGCQPYVKWIHLFQVTAYYSHNPKIDYVIEQPDALGLLKLARKQSIPVSAHRKGSGHRSTEEEYWWACGHCFFERRKKSTIKSHIMQRVCQKPVKRQLSHGDLEEDEFKGCPWKRSLSV